MGSDCLRLRNQTKKTDEKAEYPDGTLRYKHQWDTGVVVYQGDCSPSGDQLVVGFVEIALTYVGDSSDKAIYGNIQCKYVEGPTSGGGGFYGTYGSIPNIVQ